MATLQTLRLLHRTGGGAGATGTVATAAAVQPETVDTEDEQRMRHYQAVFLGLVPDPHVLGSRARFGLTQRPPELNRYTRSPPTATHGPPRSPWLRSRLPVGIDTHQT